MLIQISCVNNSSASDKILNASIDVPAVNSDSINKILIAIHAAEKAKKLDILFNEKVKKMGFNGCVLIAERGQIIYKKVVGFADIKAKDPLKINSAFQLSSTSKTLTAAAILLLKDQGKLNLDDNVQKFFPTFPYTNITIKLLLTHRSGLNNYLYFAEPLCTASNCYNGKVFDNNALLQIIFNLKPSIYAQPNHKFEYCNTNYALLASIVEKISGETFADFMDQQFFQPLQMKNTWVHSRKYDSLHSNRAIGHLASGQKEKEIFADDVLGDKGVYSTVEDLFKWDQALYSEKILKKTTIDEAFTGYSNEHKGKRNYGYGWRLIDDGNKNDKIVYHNGWWHGFNSTFYRRPSDQTTIIILSNKSNMSAYHIDDVLSIINENTKVSGIDAEE
jgi:CubicO group peptidase (beta-lactamase class C family)